MVWLASPRSAAAAWAAFYGAHRLVSVTVRWLHLSALLVGGGAAVAADRRVLGTTPGERPAALAVLGRSHPVVVSALAVAATSGALMTASDPETFLGSPAYWTKMALVLLLLLNGAALFLAERAASRHPAGRGWSVVRASSALSLLLWLAILFAGLWLTVAA
jgi:hypothetical protein